MSEASITCITIVVFPLVALVVVFPTGSSFAYEQHDIDVLPAFGTNEILIDAPGTYA